MDQKTANHVALVKIYTIAAVAIGFGAAIVYLAATHDGLYVQLILNDFPYVIFACLATLGVPWLAEIIGNTLQAKYTGMQLVPTVPTIPTPLTPPAVSSAPVDAPAPVPTPPLAPDEPVAGS